MGWASGSSLLQRVADTVMPHIPKTKRREVAFELIEAFEKEDCDTIDEVEEESVRSAYREMYGDREEY